MDMLARIAAGSVILVFGRSLFWLFVALLGFGIGLEAGAAWLADSSALVRLVLALACGLLGALLAILLQRVAVAVAGFVAFVHLVGIAARRMGWLETEVGWVVAIAAGVVGALLLVALFDVALIAISSILGAAIVADALPVAGGVAAITFVALVLVGVAVQSAWSRGRPAPAG
jgi:hypothetical protein